jgi:DNA-binding Lrp family transcriptional regulator
MNKFLKKGDVNKGLIRTFVRNVKEGAFEIFLILKAASPDGEFVEISIPKIQQRCGYSRWKVHACLKRLEEEGYIRKELGGLIGMTMIYGLLKNLEMTSSKGPLKSPKQTA